MLKKSPVTKISNSKPIARKQIDCSQPMPVNARLLTVSRTGL
jgi:hypothetical protein